ncbi:MAG: Hsp33 family molecular chaperone HslO [Candidatus Thioglobus sp.]|nr:Hsp33 family molecular chaperone HslO [Candidatus Thioglobus sp.]MBT3447300.1 Hsp33 family molecular chaperone HslO [Candidatus Thioglobus sp.]MBT3744286.1 Hsp33 family molecular chaperone HslO [Candidatus Thioglobus sp.]MBT4001573.1 Hsp33 family molecular chaperone HslO [Candidatus Thioglobus sp.]MBT4181288.1 Hsp33 family molecular chaperone HslO [Candidatus Thioglobus sp.]
MPMNTINRFLFKDLNIRGQHLSLNDAWQEMIQNRSYSPLVRQLFGELSALAIFLASGMKHQGKLTLQIQGDGVVSLLLVEVSSELKIRGMVRANGTIKPSDSLDKILGKGQIVATLYNAQTDHSFQSLVPRNSQGLVATFEDYFSQSEQLDSKLWVSSTKDNLSAMLIQKMPEADQYNTEGWHRVCTLAGTVTDKELSELDAERLLHRLFHEETLQLFEADWVSYECTQNKERFEKIIFDLGEQDARDLLNEQGEISIHNEICNEHLFFDEQDVNRIFTSKFPEE